MGKRGPVLLEDVNYLDEITHFDRERIPERVEHAKGGGAFGYFEVTHDITKYTAAKIFESVGKRSPLAMRFSTVSGERGSADTVRNQVDRLENKWLQQSYPDSVGKRPTGFRNQVLHRRRSLGSCREQHADILHSRPDSISKLPSHTKAKSPNEPEGCKYVLGLYRIEA